MASNTNKVAKSNKKQASNAPTNQEPKSNRYPSAKVGDDELKRRKDDAREFAFGATSYTEEVFPGTIILQSNVTNILCVPNQTDLIDVYRALQSVNALKQPRTLAPTDNAFMRAYGEQLSLFTERSLDSSHTVLTILATSRNSVNSLLIPCLFTKTKFIRDTFFEKLKSDGQSNGPRIKGNRHLTELSEMADSPIEEGAVVGIFSPFEGLKVEAFKKNNKAGQTVLLSNLKLIRYTAVSSNKSEKSSI